MSDIRDKEVLEWYEQFHESIFKYINMVIQDYQSAEDLRHETFLKAYVNYESFRGNSNPKTWLFSIAHNITVDYIRKRRPLTILQDVLLFKKDLKPLPEEIVEIKENSQELYNALAKLKGSYREVIILRKIKEFSIEETSIILGWSESKVKSTLFRAIQALEKKLLKEGVLNEKIV
ncbi:RNA polymerase sigma factor [Neobacillus sp. NPDC093182]|uniref:RNA polymerase sigma factor n=1 Tax=Neobacillus sp. NPDC093182 TaxID=3364297 RepID=UPI00382A19B7